MSTHTDSPWLALYDEGAAWASTWLVGRLAVLEAEVEIIDEVPKTATGKVLRRELRDNR